MEEHLAKGTSVRARQELDINGEWPGKILLKCEVKYGQQKYMQSIVTKNKRGEVTNTITGQKKLQEETAKFLGKILAYKNIETTEQDIWNYL